MRKLFFLAIFFASMSQAYSQDQTFINPNQSLLYVNPSFAGSNGSLRDQFVYRNLWPSLSGSSISFYNGLDGYAEKLHGGVGVSALVNAQVRSAYRFSQLNFIYAPRFELRATGIKLIPSVQLSYLQTNVDFQNGYTGQPASGTTPANKKSNADAAAGLLLNYRNFYAGASVFHLAQPNIGVAGDDKLPLRLSVNASYNQPLNAKTLINISALFITQNDASNYQVALNGIFLSNFLLGFGIMSQETQFVNIGFRNDLVSLMLGYDVSYSKLYGNTAGSWQLSIAASFLKKTPGEAPANFEKW